LHRTAVVDSWRIVTSHNTKLSTGSSLIGSSYVAVAAARIDRSSDYGRFTQLTAAHGIQAGRDGTIERVRELDAAALLSRSAAPARRSPVAGVIFRRRLNQPV